MNSKQIQAFALIYDSFFYTYQKHLIISPQLETLRCRVFTNLVENIANLMENKKTNCYFEDKLFRELAQLANEMFDLGLKDLGNMPELKLRNATKGLITGIDCVSEGFKKKYIY